MEFKFMLQINFKEFTRLIILGNIFFLTFTYILETDTISF